MLSEIRRKKGRVRCQPGGKALRKRFDPIRSQNNVSRVSNKRLKSNFERVVSRPAFDELCSRRDEFWIASLIEKRDLLKWNCDLPRFFLSSCFTRRKSLEKRVLVTSRLSLLTLCLTLFTSISVTWIEFC